ncbi:GNAT family N-acetyltransferase [Aureisphaera galaxeae]|uniref:GNAT family N-acetyltransferase n=1 Tax=Aureisphaera galaxeae TaxID=1538023 RepID=UPI0023501DA2|nr:GNAT family N-acetyltransferase [Aureisphaera galaxeae]MDC8005108.1 GNAT family N-acetyltransferase [Aureisphaera galaxeae]
MEIVVKTFDQLTIDELYNILQLRSEVFVVEQDCVYQDIDGKDRKALHVFGKKSGRVAAYTRCFAPGIYFEEAAIGRVVVSEPERKYGYGYDIMNASITAVEDHYQTTHIKLSAQTYLTHFYERLGFQKVGEEYLEDGIPHIGMVKS